MHMAIKVMYLKGMIARPQAFQGQYREVIMMEMEQLITVFIYTYPHNSPRVVVPEK